MTRDFTLPKYGYQVKVNKMAQQADGSAWLQQGGTVLLATAVSAPSKDFPGFLPLSVDYREQFSAAGKIPGGYFKREGRSTDKEVLTSRLIDRAIRPLFPKDYFHQVQVIVTVYSVDKEHTTPTIAALACSLALSVSKIPFLGPIGFAEVARLQDQWVVNPSYEQSLESDVKITVAGTKDGICMVEGSTNEISEKECVDALFLAHASIQEQVVWQEEIVASILPLKETVAPLVDWSMWEKIAYDYLSTERLKGIFGTDKIRRNEFIAALKEGFFSHHELEVAAVENSKKVIEYIFDEQFEIRMTELICESGKRIDLRSFDQVRKISIEVGILPFTHGSAVFTRGNTQSLATLTLGSGQDEQRIEDIMGGEVDGSFMLHYNFPPFSVGEVRFLRGPSRREVGHGHLAASAFKYVLPDKESFPYTIRIVSDILESDGSSSMATVCSSTMAFLSGGVPIKDAVGGVAMGLLKSKKSDEYTVLTDISGFEDAFGLMDFKVAGTEKGITAIQMDIKHKGGLHREVFEKALAQARQGRVYIISQMKEVMSKPNDTLSELVPQVVTFKIDTDKIGAVIGSGGKVIRQIIEATGTTIDIESDGTVKIFGQPGQGTDLAVMWVKTLAGQIKKGSMYDGIVRRSAAFGLFVEIVPGKDGLVHISTIPREKQQALDKNYPVGMKCKVEVIEYDAELDRVRLRIV